MRTPGPWGYYKLNADRHGVITKPGYEICTPDYDVCAAIERGAPIRNEDDAAFIVLACNCFDELVAALDAARRDIDSLCIFHEIDVPDEMIGYLDAALEKAMGER